jgi:hypothetical protein
MARHMSEWKHRELMEAMSDNVLATYGSNREAKEHAQRLNENRENNEVFGCQRTIDGRWQVIRVAIR